MVGGLLSRENLASLLLLGQDHDADLLGAKGLDPLARVHLLLVELGRLLDRLERIEFDVILYSPVRPVVTDHPHSTLLQYCFFLFLQVSSGS